MISSEKSLKKKNFIGSSEDPSQYFLTLKSLFKTGFAANCHLDEASVTEEELETLEDLDHGEVLENFKELVDSLIEFKRNVLESKEEDLAVKCDKLEKMLQKQECEVRKHISSEHQLKILIESIQEKNLELERKYKDAKLALKSLESENNESVHEKILKMESNFERQLTKLSEKYTKDVGRLSKESEKLNKLQSLFEQKEKSYQTLEDELSQMRGVLEKTNFECQSLRREIVKYTVKSVYKTPTKISSELQDQIMSRVKNNKSVLFDYPRKVSTSKKKVS